MIKRFWQKDWAPWVAIALLMVLTYTVAIWQMNNIIGGMNYAY